MKRKHVYKKLIPIMTVMAMLSAEIPVFASDLPDSTNWDETQEATEYMVDKEIPVETEEQELKLQEGSGDESNSGEEGSGSEGNSGEEGSGVEEGESTEEGEGNLIDGEVQDGSTEEWDYIYNKLGAALIQYNGTNTEVTIPQTIGKHNVIALSSGLFSEEQKGSIEKVTIEAGVTRLPDAFFLGFNRLQEAQLSDTIQDMGLHTFDCCAELTTVKLPASLKEIKFCAFYSCTNLKSVVIPENVTQIGDSAFSGCNKLTDINIPEKVEQIGSAAFLGCESLIEITLPDSIKTVWSEPGEEGEDREIMCSGLEFQAFEGCKNLVSVTLPKELTYLAGRLFKGCNSLKKIELPERLEVIDSEAFQDCTYLFSVSIPESVKEIGENVFDGSVLLTIYGKNGSYAQEYAKKNGIMFSSDEMKEGNYKTVTEGNWTALTDENSAAIIEYTGSKSEIIIPEKIEEKNVIALKKDLLKNANDTGESTIEEVDIQAKITSLPDLFFGDFRSLEVVTLPDTIKVIRENAFRGCENLATVTMPQDLEEIEDEAFAGCSALKAVVLPDKLIRIGHYSFQECSRLESIQIPNSVKQIGNGAFWKCTGLTEIVLSNNITDVWDEEWEEIIECGIGLNAFEECTSLTSVHLPKQLKYIAIETFKGCVSLKTVELPDTLKKIDYNAFENCTSLFSISIPESVTSINEDAFTGCAFLTIYGKEGSYAEQYAQEQGFDFSSGEMQDTTNMQVKTQTTSGGWRITTDGSRAIVAGCPSVEGSEEIVIPSTIDEKTVVALQNGCLDAMKDTLKSVKIQANITLLPSNFFEYFNSLEEVTLPDTIQVIGENAFSGCGNLTTVNLPQKLKEIKSETFAFCSALTSIGLPSGLTQIGNSAFYRCEKLNNILIPETVERIGGNAFMDCTALESIVLPDSIKTIWDGKEESDIMDPGLGACAFEGCTKLKSVQLPKDLIYMAYGLFAGCRSLETVELPEGIITIGAEVFKECSALRKIKLPETVQTIDGEAFKDCTALSNITVNPKLQEFGESVFAGDEFLVVSCVNNETAVSYAKENEIRYTVVKLEGTNMSAQIPANTFSNIDNQELAIDTADVSVVFDATAVNEIKETNAESEITLEVEDVEKGETENELQDTMIDRFVDHSGEVLDISLTDSEEQKVEFNNDEGEGTFQISLDYKADEGETPIVYCVSENGSLEEIPSEYNVEEEEMSFTTTHFSVFAIGNTELVPEGIWVNGIKDQNYTGEPIEPKISVYNHSELLEEGKYTVVYRNNTEPGIATVIVRLKEDETGQEYKTTFNIIQDHIHEGVEVSKAATCTESGQKAYYQCECGKIFRDKECKEEITDESELKSLVIPATGHKMVLASGKKNPTNTANGYTEKYRCKHCGFEQGGQVIPRISKVTLYKGINKSYKLTSGKWKLSKTKAATLKGNKVTVKKKGTVKVTDRITNQTVIIKIVNPSLSVNKKKVTLKAGQSFQLVTKAVPSRTVKYRSSKKKIASVSKNGVIKARRKGKTTIYVKANGVTKKVRVTVK